MPHRSERAQAAGARVVPGAIVRRCMSVPTWCSCPASSIWCPCRRRHDGRYRATVALCADRPNVHILRRCWYRRRARALAARPRLSRMTVSSARAPKWSRAVVERVSLPWAFSWARARALRRARAGSITAGRPAASSSWQPAFGGCYSLNCAVIVKRVDEQTRRKTALNDIRARPQRRHDHGDRLRFVQCSTCAGPAWLQGRGIAHRSSITGNPVPTSCAPGGSDQLGKLVNRASYLARPGRPRKTPADDQQWLALVREHRP